MKELVSPHALLLCLAMTTPLAAQSWQPLFDGVSLNGWTNQQGESKHGPGWEVVDGMIHLDRSKGSGGNLLTAREYGDFELVFEWTVAPGANNGIKYRVKEFGNRTLGIEYQVIDDAKHPKLSADHRTASLYDIVPAREHDWLRPAGEFNRGRIVVKDNQLEHWLNGRLIARADANSEAWKQQIAASKFAGVEGFGVNARGKIMLTDHKDEVWYRNIFIRDLTHAPTSDQIALARRTCPPRARRGFLRRRR